MERNDQVDSSGCVLYLSSFVLPEQGTGRKKHQIEHQAGLDLLRMGLKRHYGLVIEDWSSVLQKGERGKPYLSAFPWIHFNISHSKTMVVCGLGSTPLGVDIERIRPIRLPSVRRMLTKREQDYLAGCKEGERERALFRFWTLKESYAKALGVGLALDFTQVEFLPEPDQDFGSQGKMLQVGGSKGNWRFAQTIWKDEYVISFCGQVLPLFCHFVSAYEIN